MGLLELQQAQKIKKQPCWNSRKAKNQKNDAAGTPASLKNQKTALLELQQGQKSKNSPAGTPARPKIKKTELLELQQAFAHRKHCSTLNTI